MQIFYFSPQKILLIFLSNYKKFLQNIEFDIQILIQSNCEDLSKCINNIKSNENTEKNQVISLISEKYINYIQKTNLIKKSSSKNFYIIIKYIPEKLLKENIEFEIYNNLNIQILKIKENLSNLGNVINDISKKEEVEKVIYSFLNKKLLKNVKELI